MRILAAVIVALAAVTASALPPPCPCIFGIGPTFVNPAGGDIVTLTGISFREPARVFIDYDLRSVEALVFRVTSTQLQFVAPKIDMNGRQVLVTSVRAVFDSGTPQEFRASAFLPLVYQNGSLTPVVVAVSPRSGPLLGGTRVTIFGEGFQAPLQVFFGDREAQVISVSFNQVVVIAPAGAHVGPADVRIVNIGSGTTATARDAYRYVQEMEITSISPNAGSVLGGTRVTIRGSGFDVPVAITIAGQAAIPIRISGTEIVAITTPVVAQQCTNVSGPVVVVNIDNGDTATGPVYTYTCTPRRRLGR